MNIFEILFAAFFCFAMVFAFLGGLYILIKFFTGMIRFAEKKVKKSKE